MTLRLVLAAVVALAPGRARVVLGRLLLGWQVHPTARVGPSIVAARHVRLGAGARIGPFNMIKGMDDLVLGDGAVIGFFNWISGAPSGSGLFPESPERRPGLEMGDGAQVVTRHVIDCSDRVTLGDHARLAGLRSTVLTHGVRLSTGRVRTLPVTIGAHTHVMANATIVGGVVIAPRIVLSAGSVVLTSLSEECRVYAGNPAQVVRALPEDSPMFRRQSLASVAGENLGTRKVTFVPRPGAVSTTRPRPGP